MNISPQPWRSATTVQPAPAGVYFPHSNGAYVPVHARQTFSTHVDISREDSNMTAFPSHPQPYSPPKPTQPQPEQRIAWPQPVRDYVQRTFEDYRGFTKEEIEIKLKDVIGKAASSNQLSIIDWPNLDLPQTLLERERRVMALQSSTQHPPQISAHNEPSYPYSANESTSKKRKSAELSSTREIAHDLPWRKANSGSLEDRFTYSSSTSKKAKKEASSKQSSKFSTGDNEARLQRFQSDPYSSPKKAMPPPMEEGPIVGRSTIIEKNYFRLTSAPNPDVVRPLHILKQTLEHLKVSWKKKMGYTYICDQFKSMRQDLTVQRIKNEFTVNVYEVHARIALEQGDLGEYNQCQTQLHALYAQNIAGHPDEFKAYRILYFIYTCNRTDMNDLLSTLTIAEKKNDAIKHALEVRSSLALGNYHRFFQLFHRTPKMGGYLLDMFVLRERLAAMAKICRAYRNNNMKVRFIAEELGFEGDGDALGFLQDYADPSSIEEQADGFHFLPSKAGLKIETAKSESFKKVDIKGQI